MDNVYIIDVETTGPDIFTDDVLYIHIEPLKKRCPGISIYIGYPDIRWGSEPARVFFDNYKDEWEGRKVPVGAAFHMLRNYLNHVVKENNITLAGYNVGFDYYFLKKLAHLAGGTLPKVAHRLLDLHSVLYFKHLLGEVPEWALNSIGSLQFLGVQHDKRHDAAEDVRLAKEMLLKLMRMQ